MKGIGYLTVNPQGNKFAFRKNKHIWMCDIDGSNLQQITTGYTSDIISYDGESSPFLPMVNISPFLVPHVMVRLGQTTTMLMVLG